MRVAIIHDYLNQYGGAERVLEALHDLFPEAPVYTSIYDPAAMPDVYRTWDIRPSWMQRLPAWRRLFRAYVLLYPLAFESFDLSAYDLLISSSSAFAKGVIPQPDAIHVCYCHTPMRFAWRTPDYLAREGFRRCTPRGADPAAHAAAPVGRRIDTTGGCLHRQLARRCPTYQALLQARGGCYSATGRSTAILRYTAWRLLPGGWTLDSV